VKPFEISKSVITYFNVRLNLGTDISADMFDISHLLLFAVIAVIKENINRSHESRFASFVWAVNEGDACQRESNFDFVDSTKILEADSLDFHAVLPTNRTNSASASAA
jgi:hypothetical protein